MTAGDVSTVLVLGALATYVVAMVAFAVDISALGGHAPDRTRRRAAGIGMALSWLGFGLQLVGLVMRAIAAGRAPWANMYEFSLTFTLIAMAIFLVLQRRRDMRYLGVFVTFLVVVTLLLAVGALFVPADGVQPALDSYWLVIHVSMAAGATAAFSISAVASILQLLQGRFGGDRGLAAPAERSLVGVGAGAEVGSSDVIEDQVVSADGATAVAAAGSGAHAGTAATGGSGTPGTPLARLLSHMPSAQHLERFAYRLNAVGFVGWSFTLIAGAVWAEFAWGRPWGWDPKETWTLVIWLVYAAYLHMRATVGWTINRFAWIALIGFVALLANFYVVNLFFPGNHSYSGV